MFIKRKDYKALESIKEKYIQLQEAHEVLSQKCDRLTLEHLSMYNDLEVRKAIDKLENKDESSMLSVIENEHAMRYYGYGWSFQEITARILHDRNDIIRRDILREVGMCVSKRFSKQVYPLEFYGQAGKD